MRNEGHRLIKLTTAFFYDTAVEPAVINLRETTLATGIPGLLSGYFGSFAQTKGFKPVKEIADSLQKRYTIIDFTLSCREFIETETPPAGMIVNLKQLTRARQIPLSQEISESSPELISYIKMHGSFEKALIDNPLFLPEMLDHLGRFRDSVIIHSIKPNASPTLAVASIRIDQVEARLVSASCRFNQHTKVVWE
jgi:hypothetical protein